MKRMAVPVLALTSGIGIGFAAALLPAGRLAVPAAQAQNAQAQNAKEQSAKAPLFVNMTTGDAWRGWMGLHFAHATLKLGHPVTLFLNLDGVKLASLKGEPEKQPSMRRPPRDILADFIRDGGKVLICGPCLSEFGLKMEDLAPGVELGRPGYTQSFIFAADAKTLTW